jgi:hypothetical protein
MEGSPRFPNESGVPGSSERKSRRRKRGSFRVPGIASVESERRGTSQRPEVAEPRRGSLLGEAATAESRPNLFAADAETNRSPRQPREQESSRRPRDERERRSNAAHTEDTQDHTQEPEQRFEYRQLRPNELGGDVVIELNDADPLAEHVIPLHEDAHHAAVDDMKRREREAAHSNEQAEYAGRAEDEPIVLAAVPPFEPPIFRTQPEQQQMAHDAEQPPVVRSADTAPTAPSSETVTPTGQAVPAVNYEATTTVQPAEVVAQSPEQQFQPLESSAAEAQSLAPDEAMLRRYPAETTTPQVPEQLYVSHMQPMEQLPVTPPAPVPMEQMVPKRVMDRAVERAEGGGALAGLLVGGLFVRHRYRKRAKRREKEFQRQTKDLQQAREQLQFTVGEQQRKQNRTEAELHTAQRQLHDQTIRTAAVERHVAQQKVYPENTVVAAQATPVRSETAPSHQAMRLPAAAEQYPTPVESARSAAEYFAVPAAAAMYGAERAMNPNAPSGQRFEQSAPTRPAELQPNDGQLELPPDHYLDASSWLAVEMDKKTGRAAENPSREYGREYHRERAQENGQASQRTAAAGEVALVAAAMSQQGHGTKRDDEKRHGGGGSGSVISGGGGAAGLTDDRAIPSATTQGPPPRRNESPKNTQGSKHGSSSGASDQPLWPWVVALAVVVAMLVLLL